MVMLTYLIEWLTVVVSGLALGALVLASLGMGWPELLIPLAAAAALARWLYLRIG